MMGDRTRDGTGFGATLKELREKAGLSQGQLAERASMNVFGIAKLEQGQREPSWATVLAIAKALGVDCTAFSGGDQAAAAPPAKKAEAPVASGKKPKPKK